MRKISEILRQHHELNSSHRDIAKSLNLGKTTVTRYLSLAKVAGIGWPLPSSMTEDELHNLLFGPTFKTAKNEVMPNWEKVNQELRKKGVTLQLLWREYRDVHPDGIGYSHFCDCYRTYAKSISPVMKQIYKAGEKTFVDYAGMKMPWLDPTTGEIHEAEIFVGCLGASQYIFAEATASQQLADWMQSHIRMWEYFGGVSQIVVPDNLKSAVKKSHRYDPDINANYQHIGEHYGFAIVPARAYKPTDKGKVENAVGIVERQILAPLRHMTFVSIGEINIAIKERLEILNTQSFQKMKTSRRELFETIDQPALKPLPKEKYHYAEWKQATVHIDYHIVFDDHYYSVPYKYIHQRIEIRATAKTVECFYKNKRIASHMRSAKRYKHTTIKEHMPLSHRAQTEWSPARIKRWAEKTGPATKQFIDFVISSRSFPEQSYRTCLGILRLGSQYGTDRLEKACSIAFDVKATRYYEVELILKNKIDLLPQTCPVNVIIAAHQNIRGSEYYK